MLFISAVISFILLCVVNLAVRRNRQAVKTMIVGTGVALFALPCIAIPYLVVPQGVLLLAAYAIYEAGQFRFWVYLLLSTAVTVLLYGVVAAWQYRDLASLSTRYAYESIEERLPLVIRSSSGDRLSSSAQARLDELEERIEWGDHSGRRRSLMLMRLHEQTVGMFISSPGFGVTRMPYVTDSSLAISPARETTPRQPGFDDMPSWSPRELKGESEREGPPSVDLLKMHEGGALDFLHPKGFGYVKDRRHVAGFQPHQFSQVPEPKERWKLERLDLVSLLLHEEPVAYVSARLPKMDELREAPTRQLDEIEVAGLKALREGEDLFVRPTEGGVRMLGSLRAVKQCLSCHDARRGDLLGAFSYTLRPAK